MIAAFASAERASGAISIICRMLYIADGRVCSLDHFDRVDSAGSAFMDADMRFAAHPEKQRHCRMRYAAGGNVSKPMIACLTEGLEEE